jgi:hypothetical protein
VYPEICAISFEPGSPNFAACCWWKSARAASPKICSPSWLAISPGWRSTCYGGEPAGLAAHNGPECRFRVFHITDFAGREGRASLGRQLRAEKYELAALICSNEPIMTKWKWWVAFQLPVKVLIVNENADYFWFDYTNSKTIWHFIMFRAGMSGADAVSTLARLALFPFTLLCLLLYAARACAAVAPFATKERNSRMKAIVIETPGGPEATKLQEVPTPKPGEGQALVKIAASGVNFIDVYFRIGLYKADPPITLGMEAAGTVEAVGAGVTDVKPGDRVAYAMQRGSHAEYAVVPACRWPGCAAPKSSAPRVRPNWRWRARPAATT